MKEKKGDRLNFVFFKNWVDTINLLPEEFQLETFKSLCEYGLSGEMPSDTSAVVKAILQSFSIAIDNSITRQKTNVKNGKKGGNPNFKKGQPNPYYLDKKTEKGNQLMAEDNQKITIDNPNKEDESEEENEHEKEDEFEKEDRTSLLNKKYLSSDGRAREDEEEIKKLLIEKYKKYFDFWKWDEKGNECYYEIMGVLASVLINSRHKKLRYRQKTYSEDDLWQTLDKLDDEDIRAIIWQMNNNGDIKNREIYILGAVINRAEERL